MYLFMGQEEGQDSLLHSQLVSALQTIKQLEPPLSTSQGMVACVLPGPPSAYFFLLHLPCYLVNIC